MLVGERGENRGASGDIRPWDCWRSRGAEALRADGPLVALLLSYSVSLQGWVLDVVAKHGRPTASCVFPSTPTTSCAPRPHPYDILCILTQSHAPHASLLFPKHNTYFTFAHMRTFTTCAPVGIVNHQNNASEHKDLRTMCSTTDTTGFAYLMIGGVRKVCQTEDRPCYEGGCSKAEAEMFTVYGVMAEDDVEAIEDLKTFDDAVAYAASLGLPVTICRFLV